jgi:DNA-binding HxlR family transcriptional regulator
MSTNQLALLEQLGRHRWTVPLIATLAARNGGRFIELLNVLGVSRDSLSRTLDASMAIGWVVRNPGHGHPLRPEYILTDSGRAAAISCAAIAAAQVKIALPPTSLTRWSLPLLHLVDLGERRFSNLLRALPQSNPRALTQSLKSMIGQQLLDRQVINSFPPTPEYGLAPRGMVLAEALVYR